MNDEQNREESSPEWKVPAEEQLPTDAYHIWKPRPMLRSVHWKPVPEVPRDAAAGSYDIFLDQRAFSSMHQHVWNAAPGERPFGFLAGDLCEDPDSGRRYLIVSAAIPSRFSMNEEGPDQLPGEALVALQLEVDRRRGVLAGWYHSHPTGEVRLTDTDVASHEAHFPEPWQTALLFVTDHDAPGGGCFRRTRDGFSGAVSLPFFEVVSNESLLARGLRRSFLDWENVQTIDAIAPEPPPRPEPPPLAPEPEMTAAGADTDDTEVEGEDVDLILTPATEADEEAAAEPLADELAAEEPLADELADEEPLAEEPAPDAVALEEVEPLAMEDEVYEPQEVEELSVEDELHELEEVEPLAMEDEDLEPEELPEPGWDSVEGEPAEAPASLDEMDLDSFVTEVEAADIDGQMEPEAELTRIEPDWDEVVPPDTVEIEPLATSPVYEELPLEDLESPPADELPDVEVAEPAVEPDAFVDEVPEVESTDLEPVVDQEPVPAPKPPAKRRRSRRPVFVVGAVLLLALVAVSVLMFTGPSEQAGPGTTPTAATGSSPSNATDGPESVPPVEGDPAEADGADPTAEPAASDTTLGEGTTAQIEALGESLLESISRYYGLAVAVDEGRSNCTELQTAYVEVEDRWMSYNVEGKARFRGRLPDELAVRDERLYSGVQDVEREFGRSGCPRP